jgi:hypothetical protein
MKSLEKIDGWSLGVAATGFSHKFRPAPYPCEKETRSSSSDRARFNQMATLKHSANMRFSGMAHRRPASNF